jgi:hypothetical protein
MEDVLVMYFALTEKPRQIQRTVRSFSEQETVVIAGSVIKVHSLIPLSPKMAVQGFLGHLCA